MNQNITEMWRKYRDMILISLLCIPVGALIGGIDAVFGRVLLYITAFRGDHVLQLIPLLGLGGAFVAWYYQKFGKGTEKGMSLVFEAAQGKADHVPLRLIPFITLGTWITHLFGGSAGREGVAVQIGGTLSFWIGKRIPIKNASRIFLIAGMAAGFAGLFRTPIAAVFFALEVLTAGALVYRALLPALVSAYTASTVSGMLGLEKFTATLTDQISLTPILFGKLIVLGIVFGAVGGCFAVMLKHGEEFCAKKCENPVLRIAVVGVILSVILLLLHNGRYAGLGTNLISASFHNEPIYGYDWIIKLLLTVLTLSAGFQGGEVTPLFSIGASLGVALGGLMGLPVQFAAALGYAAVFGSASNTFLAPMLIGAEVFGFAYIPYFFIVCAISYVLNHDQTIYGKQQVLRIFDANEIDL